MTSSKSDSGELLVVANALGAFFDLEKGRAAVIDPTDCVLCFVLCGHEARVGMWYNLV